MSWRFFVHFSQLPLIQKVLYTSALLVLGLGYAFAGIYIYASHSGRDGDAMLTVKDIVIAYSGSKSGTVLEGALRGPMSNMLPPEENLEIVAWVRKGVNKEEYDKRIASILEKRCIACHNNRNPHLPSLEGYDNVLHTAEEDTGMDLYTLVRVSHIHTFGLTFIFFIVGMVFSHAYLRQEWLKIAIIVTPFVSIIIDISSWYITKIFEPFAWLVMISGGMMALSFTLQFFISLYQMWFYKLPESAHHTAVPESKLPVFQELG